jgi:hypothetical protein
MRSVLFEDLQNRYVDLLIYLAKDHVVHGAIASICTYGALMGATP